MKELLYLTADVVGLESGGGLVTKKEYEFLSFLGETKLLSRDQLSKEANTYYNEPWKWDKSAYYKFGNAIKLAHIYSGTFSECVFKLKSNGSKVTYTAAAHDINLSKEEHRKLGIPFNYNHLTTDSLWRKYLDGYLRADVVICPSVKSMEVMYSYGCKNIRIIPHGIEYLDDSKLVDPPKNFVLGYLGSYGPDKGIRYLLEAWNKLNYKDDSKLVLAGRDSTSDFVSNLINQFCLDQSNIQRIGWVDNVSNFYNSLTCYCQPSVTEGFGLEVVEAINHGRQVVCSTGVGACSYVPNGFRYDPFDVKVLCELIDTQKQISTTREWTGDNCRSFFDMSTIDWQNIKKQYHKIWKELF